MKITADAWKTMVSFLGTPSFRGKKFVCKEF